MTGCVDAGTPGNVRPAPRALAIVGSSGILEVLGPILGGLSRCDDVAVIVMIHLPESGIDNWPSSLQRHTTLPVREAEDRAPACAAAVHVAPPGYHLLVERSGCFSLSLDPRVRYVRPSADVLLQAVADCWRERAAAVVLTGANDDGANGLQEIRKRGGRAFVQSPDDAALAFMPRSALRRAGADSVLPAARLGEALCEWTQ